MRSIRPWYSSHGSDFTGDLGLGTGFGLSVLLRDGDEYNA